MKGRRTFTLAPDVINWLSEQPNASVYVEALVRADRDGGLVWHCAQCRTVAAEQPRYCQQCGTIPAGSSE